jgi:tetratricopeptide (TPR) repeat protein
VPPRQHARVVDAIERLHRDRPGEQVERLAHHAVRGELGEKAVPYLRQAGLKAAARSALREAQIWFEQALGVLAAARLGDLRLRILATTYLAQVHFYRGDFERSVELATDSLSMLPADWAYEPFGNSTTPMSVYCRLWVVHSLAVLGRFAEAALHEAELLRFAGPTQHAYTVGEAYNAAGMLHLHKGDWATARSLLEHSIAALRAGNVAVVLSPVVATSAWVLAQVGEVSEAQTQLREGEQLLEPQVARGVILAPYHQLGRAALLLGRLDEVLSLGDRAVKHSQSRPGTAALALHLLGEIATHPDRSDAASGEAYYRKALALAEPRGMRPLVAHCHLGLGKLYRRRGKRQEAQEHLTTATTMYREMAMRFWLEKAEAELRELS